MLECDLVMVTWQGLALPMLAYVLGVQAGMPQFWFKHNRLQRF